MAAELVMLVGTLNVVISPIKRLIVSLSLSLSLPHLHTDYLPLSWTKLALINYVDRIGLQIYY